MFLVAALLAIGGCLVGPDYETPSATVNPTWLEAGDDELSTAEAQEVEWWKSFEDPVLDSLVEEAYRQNLTLSGAAVRVVQALALRGIAVGELFPQSQQVSGAAGWENPPGPGDTASFFSLGFDAVWELDVWGKYRRTIESADAALDASLAGYDEVMVTLVSEVAATYVQIRTLQARVRIAEDNVGYQKDSLRMAQSRFDSGESSELDVAEARAVLEQTLAAVPALNAQVKQAMFQLNVLLGGPPSDLLARLGDTAGIPEPPAHVAVGLPADLLRRRPDIRLAERQAAAQSAGIGVEESLLYPSFFLSGSLGLQSDSAGNLFDSGSWTGNIMPGFSWPILNYGRLENNVRAQDAEFQAAVINYRNTVLVAAKEVEGSLAAFRGAQAQVKHYAASVEAAKRSLELSQLRYSEGSSTFTRVLNAQIQLRAVQEAEAVTQGQIATSLIAAHKALGGGWEIRNGMSILPEDTRAEMEARTNWGDMLAPDYVSGSDLGIDRHDPDQRSGETGNEE